MHFYCIVFNKIIFFPSFLQKLITMPFFSEFLIGFICLNFLITCRFYTHINWISDYNTSIFCSHKKNYFWLPLLTLYKVINLIGFTILLVLIFLSIGLIFFNLFKCIKKQSLGTKLNSVIFAALGGLAFAIVLKISLTFLYPISALSGLSVITDLHSISTLPATNPNIPLIVENVNKRSVSNIFNGYKILNTHNLPVFTGTRYNIDRIILHHDIQKQTLVKLDTVNIRNLMHIRSVLPYRDYSTNSFIYYGFDTIRHYNRCINAGGLAISINNLTHLTGIDVQEILLENSQLFSKDSSLFLTMDQVLSCDRTTGLITPELTARNYILGVRKTII